LGVAEYRNPQQMQISASPVLASMIGAGGAGTGATLISSNSLSCALIMYSLLADLLLCRNHLFNLDLDPFFSLGTRNETRIQTHYLLVILVDYPIQPVQD